MTSSNLNSVRHANQTSIQTQSDCKQLSKLAAKLTYEMEANIQMSTSVSPRERQKQDKLLSVIGNKLDTSRASNNSKEKTQKDGNNDLNQFSFDKRGPNNRNNFQSSQGTQNLESEVHFKPLNVN